MVIADLLRRLWIEPPAANTFRSLQDMCERWAQELDEHLKTATTSLDPALAAEGIAVLRGLSTSAPRSALLCTDLHAGNVLSAEREPWLVIDPKPCIGDPAFDVLQHLLNCSARLQHDPIALVARIAELADVDRARVRLWLFARCVQESPGRPDLAGIARRIAPA